MFLPLTKNEIKQIALLLLKKVKKNLADRNIVLDIDDKALSLMADLGYDPQFGARPLKRVIQKELINELSKLVLSNELGDGDQIVVSSDNKGLTFKIVEQKIEKEKVR